MSGVWTSIFLAQEVGSQLGERGLLQYPLPLEQAFAYSINSKPCQTASLMKEAPGVTLVAGSGRRRVGKVVARGLAECV